MGRRNFCVLAASIFALASQTVLAATVAVDISTEHQTILGWGAASWCAPYSTQALRDEIVKEAVNDMGLTRLRLELPSGNRSDSRRWEWLNDDGDPHHIDWGDFNTADLDSILPEIVLPFKREVEANGDPSRIYVSPSFFNGGSSGEVPVWLLRSPGEYSEFAISVLLHLKNNYGIDADYYCICNEAGNNNYFSAQIVGKIIKTLGPWLANNGLSSEIEFPECVSANASWNYIQALVSDTLVWPHIGMVSYHLYGTNDPYRAYIRDFAISMGLPTAQTEFMNLTIDYLYDDMILGGVSVWEVYGQGQWIGPNYDETSFTRSAQYWDFRQVMHYVRPGDVRVEASSDDPAVRPLAFSRAGKTILVLLNNTPPHQPRTLSVVGLSRGRYGICQSVSSAAYSELGPVTVYSTDSLVINMPSNSVITIYPLERTNQPPTLTDWRATPSYLTLPASAVLLSARATDPELDSLAYLWSVKSQPGGASVALGSPDSASTSATGMAVMGKYVFTVSVSDGALVSLRDVTVNVHATNQPPGVDDVHNRIPVMVTLPVDSTLLRSWAWDLEGDPLTHLWTVLSQPPGASVSLSTPNSASCTATAMSVPGDYVFEYSASDPTHTVRDTLVVPVYPLNTAPTTDSAGANPDSLVLPGDSTLLWAATSDADGDTITHWWEVKSSPPGAAPSFDWQGHATTMVRGLTVPGRYTFTITVIDMTLYSTRDVSVDVLVGVAEGEERRAGASYGLSQASQNPSGSAALDFSLPCRSTATVSVYDAGGRLVRRLFDGETGAGVHALLWDGTNGGGEAQPSGVYFLRLVVPRRSPVTRMIVLLK
jgi:hypothetical protein